MPTFGNRPAQAAVETALWHLHTLTRDPAARPPDPSEDTNVQLVAVYQPVVDLTTQRVVAVEALTRFLASHRTPEQWFAQAARNGTAVALELAAARAALRALPALPDRLPVALNFSPTALLDPAVTALLAPHAHRLVVQVTERQPVPDFEGLRAALTPLRAAGAQLAADDLGAGYASIDHVSQLKPDILKIDRAIVADVADRPGPRAFIATVADFAEQVGVRVIAEGIETLQQLRELRSLGIGQGQGHLLGRPTSPARIRRRHAAWPPITRHRQGQ